MHKITPFLWFDDQAEEAMNFYVSIFKNSKILNVARAGESDPGKSGSVMMGSFELDGLPLVAFNGGPAFQFNEAMSFFVDCADQAEVDYFWEKLTAEGGQPGQCGWLKDKFGVSWQIVPAILGELLNDPDQIKSRQVMQAMLAMSKIDIAALQRAHDALE